MTDARDLFFPGSIPAAIPELADLPTVTPASAPTWVLYKPDPTDRLFVEPTGLEGEWSTASDPADVAREIITEYAGGHPDWIAELYGPDGRTIAWAKWEAGVAVAQLIRARKTHGAERGT